MDRDRNESRICENSKEKNISVKYIRPAVISELAPVYIAGDGKTFIDEQEAKNYQETIMVLHEEDIKLTNEQKKEKVKEFLEKGNYNDVLDWISKYMDIFDEMNYRMNDWDDDIFGEEYDNLVTVGYINED